MAILFTISAAPRAQVAPAATGPGGLPVSGTLHYDLRYSQTAQFGGGQDGLQRSNASGDASYANISKRLPFTMQYGGGYSWTWNGPPSAGGVFQHLSLTQGIAGRAWNLVASDNVSYTFEAPTMGFTGVPGTGEPIGGSGPTTPPDQTVLTVNTRTLDHIVAINFGDRLNHAWSLNISGTSGQMYFIDSNGLNMDTLAANAGVTRRLNARNSVSGLYSFSRFNYGVNSTSLANSAPISYNQVNSAQVSFQRQWNSKIATSASAGPQWISSSDSAIVPSSTRFFANTSVTDTFKHGTVSLVYTHGTTGGSGYMPGAESDIASANYSRGFGKNLTVGATSSFMRTAGLVNNEVTSAKYGGAQATRRLGRYYNVFASYTAIDQSSSFQNAPNVLNAFSQTIGIGIGYSPREVRINK